MYLSHYNARLSITLGGAQETSLDTFRRPAGERSHLVVTTGPVLTYCHSPKAVLIQHEAWSNALRKARRVFPDGYEAPKPWRAEPVTSGQPIVAQVTSQPEDTWDVTGWAAAASRDGLPALLVRVGALTLICRDQIAVEDLHDIWNDATTHAPTLWRPAREQHRQPLRR
jgi:hypothetical protein